MVGAVVKAEIFERGVVDAEIFFHLRPCGTWGMHWGIAGMEGNDVRHIVRGGRVLCGVHGEDDMTVKPVAASGVDGGRIAVKLKIPGREDGVIGPVLVRSELGKQEGGEIVGFVHDEERVIQDNR